MGGLSYVPHDDGTVEVDAAWVETHVRTESVPILGSVTGHRLMLPQLRGAMAELATAGLDDLVRPEDYGGSWVPRFIGRDPERGLSLHTWGIAVDLNVSTNAQGTPGDMDPRVVDTMVRWGFSWGGWWDVPDPMHFELAAVTDPR